MRIKKARNLRAWPHLARQCEPVHYPRGNEQPADSTGKTPVSENGDAGGGAIVRQTAPADADLPMIVKRWPMQPDDVRRSIVTMVEAAE
jgi:hypothetical protein